MTDPQTSTPPLKVDDSEPSTSRSSANGGFHYDVFISHRGPNAKNTFASYIYHRLLSHGMQPFFNREELQVGDYLTPQIEGTIRNAFVHIVIFSPRFAESKWCLHALSCSIPILPVLEQQSVIGEGDKFLYETDIPFQSITINQEAVVYEQSVSVETKASCISSHPLAIDDTMSPWKKELGA